MLLPCSRLGWPQASLCRWENMGFGTSTACARVTTIREVKVLSLGNTTVCSRAARHDTLYQPAGSGAEIYSYRRMGRVVACSNGKVLHTVRLAFMGTIASSNLREFTTNADYANQPTAVMCRKQLTKAKMSCIIVALCTMCLMSSRNNVKRRNGVSGWGAVSAMVCLCGVYTLSV